MLNVEEIKQRLSGVHCSLHIVSCALDSGEAISYKTRDEVYYYNLTPSSDLQDAFSGSL